MHQSEQLAINPMEKLAIQSKISTLFSEIPSETCLIAVSKGRSISQIQAAFDAGVQHFGENYLQELQEKIIHFPHSLKWHYIGQLQGKKIKTLALMRNLYMVQSVDSKEHAISLDFHRKSLPKLNVMIQVNVSGEKNGCSPEEALDIGRFIEEKCWNLTFRGFMTIGSLENSSLPDSQPNPDYVKLAALRENAQSNFSRPLQLSMGMSQDWRKAVALKADYIRLGKAIFDFSTTAGEEAQQKHEEQQQKQESIQ